jgi:hypothetical protein
MKTKVIFRIWPEGDIIALFPQEASDPNPYHCSSYMHQGQHAAANPQALTYLLRRATPAEYRPLAKELRRLGYRLDIRRRITRQDLEVRRAQL